MNRNASSYENVALSQEDKSLKMPEIVQRGPLWKNAQFYQLVINHFAVNFGVISVFGKGEFGNYGFPESGMLLVSGITEGKRSPQMNPWKRAGIDMVRVYF